MARPKSYDGEIVCKWCKTEMVAKGWSASEGHIWVCPNCKARKFEFDPKKGEVIYTDNSAPRKRRSSKEDE